MRVYSLCNVYNRIPYAWLLKWSFWCVLMYTRHLEVILNANYVFNCLSIARHRNWQTRRDWGWGGKGGDSSSLCRKYHKIGIVIKQFILHPHFFFAEAEWVFVLYVRFLDADKLLTNPFLKPVLQPPPPFAYSFYPAEITLTTGVRSSMTQKGEKNLKAKYRFRNRLNHHQISVRKFCWNCSSF